MNTAFSLTPVSFSVCSYCPPSPLLCAPHAFKAFCRRPSSCAYVKNNKPPLSFRMPWTRTRTNMVQLGFEPATIIDIGTWVQKATVTELDVTTIFLWALCFYIILAMKLQNTANLSSDQSKFIISILTNNILPNFMEKQFKQIFKSKIWFLKRQNQTLQFKKK